MKKMILAVFLFTLFATSSIAGEIPGVLKSSWGVDGISDGLFCNIKKVEVCVIAKNEEDCKILEGAKVDSCPSSQEEE